MRKAMSVLLLGLLLAGIFASWLRMQSGKADQSTLIVPDDYSTIQAAVNAADDGDTIYVRNGTYFENVILNKSISLTGENREATFIDGNGTTSDILCVTTRNCAIEGFTMRNGGSGITLTSLTDYAPSDCNNTAIYDNTIENCTYGIAVRGDGSGMWSGPIGTFEIVGNSINANAIGVGSWYCSGPALIANNSFSFNKVAGIRLGPGNTLDIRDNTICLGDGDGIGLHIGFGPHDSGGLTGDISGNHIWENHCGIGWYGNEYHGEMDFPGTVYNNTIENNDFGLRIYVSDIWDLDFYHNNMVNNSQQAQITVNGTYYSMDWDSGYPSGGNFWDDYGGVDEYSGVNQSLPGRDEIGDSPYTVYQEYQTSIDRYPLIRPWGQDSSIPVATFTCNPTQPLADEEIVFNASTSYDLDGFITDYAWNFGDDSEIPGPGEVQSHSYSKAGIYNVTLSVRDNSSLTTIKTRRIVVGKIPSEIFLSANPTELKIREQTTLLGSINPSRPKSNVTIWAKPDGEPTWETLANLETNETSQYTYTWTPPAVGIYSLKGNWTGNDKTTSSESSEITVTCDIIPTELSLSTTASTVFVGFQVNMTGRLGDFYNYSLTGETIVLYYTFSGITTWTPITSAITDSSGLYSVTWIPTATGYFVLKAEWAGNATHSYVNSTTTLSTISYSNQYVFTVESNSTISELAFNTTDWSLSFSATGPNNTAGYVKVTTAKTLVPNPENIRVYLDGNQTQFSIDSIDDSWLLTFEYPHSSHQVQVDLDVTIVPEFSANLLLLLFSVVVLAFTLFKCRSSREPRIRLSKAF